MSVLLQEFESQVRDRGGEIYRALLYAESRPHDTWQGWIVFERLRDAVRFSTEVETTQPNREAVLYWATGLTGAYFEGALERALRRRSNVEGEAQRASQPKPVVDASTDRTTRKRRLLALEREILAFFRRSGEPRVSAQALFDSLPHAHADVVRALEDLEKQRRMIVRQTEQGNDWIFLTESGLREVGLHERAHDHDEAPIDPPKSVP